MINGNLTCRGNVAILWARLKQIQELLGSVRRVGNGSLDHHHALRGTGGTVKQAAQLSYRICACSCMRIYSAYLFVFLNIRVEESSQRKTNALAAIKLILLCGIEICINYNLNES